MAPNQKSRQTTRQASLHATDRSVAPTTVAFDAGLRPGPSPGRAAAGTPFFLYASFTTPHPPLMAHPDFAGSSGSRGAVPDGLVELDYRAGQILA
jgi:hypothetical protein